MTDIEKLFNDLANQQCEKDFALWSRALKLAHSSCANMPSGLDEQLNLFINQHKHVFFRAYKERVLSHAKKAILEAFNTPILVQDENKMPLVNHAEHILGVTIPLGYKLDSVSLGELGTPMPTNKNDLLPIPPANTKFNDIKDRMFVEAYVMCNMNARRTAALLGIPKSSFHDWVKNHAEYVNSEVRKTRPDFKGVNPKYLGDDSGPKSCAVN